MHDIRYDAVHDELYVNNPFAAAVLVFRGGATGEEPPIRVIQGPHTQLASGRADRLDIDPVHNELYVPDGDFVRVFPMNAHGDVAPIRILKGPDTLLQNIQSVAVDGVNNIIAVGTGAKGGGAPDDRYGDLSYDVKPTGEILIFNRTDNGNVKPRAVIGGPKAGIVQSNQLQVYPPKGWIILAQPGRVDVEEPPGIYVGVWHYTDNGDVPPRWKLTGPKTTLMKPRGVALDPKHKEIIIADMRLNAVLTYYFPEIF